MKQTCYNIDDLLMFCPSLYYIESFLDTLLLGPIFTYRDFNFIEIGYCSL